MSERAASKVCAEGRRVQVEELVKGVDRGIHWLAVYWWYCGVFKALGEIIDRGGRQGGGGWGGRTD